MSKGLQQELALLGQLTNELKQIDARLAALCDTEQAAFRLCINQSPVYRSQADISDHLGMSEGAFNTVLNSDRAKRNRTLTRTHQEKLQTLCQNVAIDQWASLYRKGMLNCQRSQEQELSDARALVERLEAQRSNAA